MPGRGFCEVDLAARNRARGGCSAPSALGTVRDAAERGFVGRSNNRSEERRNIVGRLALACGCGMVLNVRQGERTGSMTRKVLCGKHVKTVYIDCGVVCVGLVEWCDGVWRD